MFHASVFECESHNSVVYKVPKHTSMYAPTFSFNLYSCCLNTKMDGYMYVNVCKRSIAQNHVVCRTVF